MVLGTATSLASFYAIVEPLSVQTVAFALGVLVCGTVGDRWDKRRVSAACLLMHGLALLTLAYASTWVLAAGITHGLAWGMRGPLMQAMPVSVCLIETLAGLDG